MQDSIEATMTSEVTTNMTPTIATINTSTISTTITSTVTTPVKKVIAPVSTEKFDINQYNDILSMDEKQYPQFTLAKNKARFLRMVNWYKQKQDWLEVAPLSGVTKLFKQQTKELDGIRSNKLDYEMELEMDTLTPSQRAYRLDELKMCQLHERMAVQLISKMQVKIKSGRR